MSIKKFLDLDGLSHFMLVLKNKFVAKEKKTGSTTEFKVLSDNNLTDALKTKIENAGTSNFSGAYDDLSGKPDLALKENIANKITQISSSSTDTQYPSAKAVYTVLSKKADSTVIPTNNNQLANGAGYQTASQVNAAINNAISEITGIDFQIVSSLPQTGVKGVIYLISNSGSTSNIYDEYIWVTDKFEKIGTTAVDLTGYLKESDLIAITNEEIDTICAA